MAAYRSLTCTERRIACALMIRSPLIRLLLFGLVGAAFGRAISLIPSQEAQEVFWVANLSSPWLVLSFLAGFFQRSLRWAGTAGIVADVSCVLGFYAGFLSLDPQRLDLARSTPLFQVGLLSLSHWLVFIAPWVLFAIGAGVIYGLAGYWWARTGSLLPVAMVTIPFMIEPLLWRIRMGFFQAPAMLWVIEVSVGVAAFAVMTRLTRRPVHPG
jgi:hypothetical protein